MCYLGRAQMDPSAKGPSPRWAKHVILLQIRNEIGPKCVSKVLFDRELGMNALQETLLKGMYKRLLMLVIPETKLKMPV